MMNRTLHPFGIECVKPEGWLKKQLLIQAKGLSRKLFDVWDSTGSYSGWLGGTGEDWERGPYYIDGILPLAYYTNDDELHDIAMKFIDYTLQHQDAEGNFGPQTTKSDWWSRVVMLKVLLQHYEISHDERVLDFMERYFIYMNAHLEEHPITQWGAARIPDLLFCLLRFSTWRTLDCFAPLVETLQKQTLDWCDLYENFPFTRPTSYYYNWNELKKESTERVYELMQYHPTHIVNVTMGLKHPAVMYLLTGDADYRRVLEKGLAALTRYHGVATGMFNGDEHLSGPNPTQGTELCAVVEFMFSLEVIMEALGDRQYADLLEKIAYNALPATITEDFMAHQYLQQVNQISATDAPRNWFNNQFDANTYGLEPHFGCCTANMHQGWPKFLRGLWFLEGERNITAMAYAPCRLATVMDGQEIVLTESTDYPFKDTLTFTLEQGGGAFGLNLRIPGWCNAPRVSINGGEQTIQFEDGFIRLRQLWKTGDVIRLKLPMEVFGTRWYHNSLSVQRGPLIFGLQLQEDWKKIKTAGGIHDYQVTTPDRWNYALAGLQEVEVVESDVSATPFSKHNPPVTLEVKAVLLEHWQEENNITAEIPQSPVKATTEETSISLIPYGCTKLRVAQFPTTF